MGQADEHDDQPVRQRCHRRPEPGIQQPGVEFGGVEEFEVVEVLGQGFSVSHPPAVLRWSGARAVDHQRGRIARKHRQDPLQADGEVPVIAVVVDIAEDVARLLEDLVQPDRSRAHGFAGDRILLLDLERARKDLGSVIEGIPTD